jgi:hypothetical protein
MSRLAVAIRFCRKQAAFARHTCDLFQLGTLSSSFLLAALG